jgi:hypothetical protein
MQLCDSLHALPSMEFIYGFSFSFASNLIIQHCSALGVTRSDAMLH